MWVAWRMAFTQDAVSVGRSLTRLAQVAHSPWSRAFAMLGITDANLASSQKGASPMGSTSSAVFCGGAGFGPCPGATTTSTKATTYTDSTTMVETTTDPRSDMTHRDIGSSTPSKSSSTLRGDGGGDAPGWVPFHDAGCRNQLATWVQIMTLLCYTVAVTQAKDV